MGKGFNTKHHSSARNRRLKARAKKSNLAAAGHKVESGVIPLNRPGSWSKKKLRLMRHRTKMAQRHNEELGLVPADIDAMVDEAAATTAGGKSRRTPRKGSAAAAALASADKDKDAGKGKGKGTRAGAGVGVDGDGDVAVDDSEL